jgi:hypothetical protein
VLIERLPNQRFDNRLTADVQVLRSSVQFFQHGGRHVHVNPLNRLHHAALALEKMRYVFVLIRLVRDGVGGNRFA